MSKPQLTGEILEIFKNFQKLEKSSKTFKIIPKELEIYQKTKYC